MYRYTGCIVNVFNSILLCCRFCCYIYLTTAVLLLLLLHVCIVVIFFVRTKKKNCRATTFAEGDLLQFVQGDDTVTLQMSDMPELGSGFEFDGAF